MSARGVPLSWWGLSLVFGCALQVVRADQIRLQDGVQLEGLIVDRDHESVLIKLPRPQIASVNGKPLPPPVGPGTPAPLFQGTDMTGTVRVVPEPTAKATLVKFWATWCPHCRADIGLMKDLTARYGSGGFALVTVSVDRDIKALEKLVQHEHITYPVLAAYGSDTTLASVPERYEARGIPAYYLIDARGVIVHVWSGSLRETGAAIEDTLTQLLTSASP